jgi:hypothetical protein
MRLKILFFISLLLLLGGAAGWWYWHVHTRSKIVSVPAELQLDKVEKTHRIVLFVHGTFGSTLGLLDVPSVMRDNLRGSLYAKTARSMRKDNFFFSSQPLLHRGLVPFEPSFDVRESIGFFAAYPIGKALETVFEQRATPDEIRHYYSFGWSGLLSQQKRRQEAIRLLNELNAEVAKFKERGITPQITVLCHSHGGNLLLNVGALVSILRCERLSTVTGVENAAALEELKVSLARLPERDVVADFKGQKKLDYRPDVPSWNINECMFFGTPVQPETDFAIGSSLFESMYHCYSLADRVQPSDWISTSRYYSEQRFDRIEKLLNAAGKKLPQKLVQIRLMFDRAISDDGKFVSKASLAGGGKKFSLWNVLVGEFDSKPLDEDPTHKEFWFLVFSKNIDQHVIKPLPVVVFAPCIIDALKPSCEHVDVDLNIAHRGEALCFEVADHKKGSVFASHALSFDVVHRLRMAAKMWEADADFLAQEESLLSQHLRTGREC